MAEDSQGAAGNRLEALSQEASGSSRKRAAGFALTGALLVVAAGFLRERGWFVGLLGAPGAILFLAGGFTMVFGRDAAQKKGLAWSLLRIGFGLISLLILVVGAALVFRATR